MSLSRCPRHEMMGRGADGRPGTEEDPTPASSAPPEVARPGVDLFVQARKALSFRCPFDAEESAPRVPTLPSGLASFLLRASEGHRKHKKSQGESADKPSGHGKLPTVWDETEEYFRPVTLLDMDMLMPKVRLGSSLLDSCLTMPVIGIAMGDGNKDGNLEATAAELSSISLPNKEEVLPEQHANEVEKVQAAEQAQLMEMEIDKVVTPGGDALPLQLGENDSFSLHWLLGSKERYILTSERPNKKRKLLGGDAGLDRLLQLPHSLSGASLCDFCCSAESRVKSNKLLCCHSCKVMVHQKCYGVNEVPEGVWLCAWCKHLETSVKNSVRDGQDPDLRPCLLCPKEGGALKVVRRDSSLSSSAVTKFVHLFCSLWTPEVHMEETRATELVMNMGGIEDRRRKLVCNVCKVKHGVCIRCSHGTCRTSFHPLCARESKHQMEIWGKFGLDNVELRAFCSKHSTFPDMSSSVKDPKNLILSVDDHSLKAKPSSAVLPAKKLPKLRLPRKNRDKILMQNEIANLSSENVVQMVSGVEQNALASRLKFGSGQTGLDAEMDFDGVIDTGNIKRSTVDVSAILRKLIDRGKINADDVASEMGISLDSLQAALVGETTSFSPGLRLKIIKWLQNSVHMSALQTSRVRSSPAMPSDFKVKNIDGLDAAKEKDPENNPAGDMVTSVEISDAVLVKSLPPRGRTKSNIRILKNNRTLRSTGVTSVLENGNGKIVDETNVISKDVKGDINDKKCSNLIEGFANEQKLLEKIMEGASKVEDSILNWGPNQGERRSPLRIGTNDLSDAEYKANDIDKKVSSLDCDGNQAGDANAIISNALERDCSNNFDGEDVVLSSKPALENGRFGSVSNIHPLIKKKLLHTENSTFFKNNSGVPFSNDAANSLCPSCTQQGLACSCTDTNHALDGAKLDQLSKAKSMGFFELSPEDEVEGEIVYLQARLLDNDVVIKRSCENLLLKIVWNLPHELNASNKCKWDLILVNQFLREVREAKKWGRKERRHKEAQAVLAAAAASAAASSRNSSLRKDSNDEVILATQESPVKVNAASGRAGLQTPPVPRAKEASRSSVAKLSSDKHSLAFQMPDLLKDNALFCEICMRTETILNRIFVCSSCKVAVHLDCYRRLRNPIGPWKCELCEDMSLSSTSPKSQIDGKDRSAAVAQCGLCGGVTGALRKSADGQWVHAFCAEWLLESRFRRGQENLIEGMDAILKEKDTCGICYRNLGACLKCSYEHCRNTFHPSCARAAGFYMNARATGGSLQHKAYCGKHSIEQREVDNQQCAAEDLKNLKQIRVELEKLRLLCERIIKREKLKRELVLCSHDILASRRDCDAYSVLVRSSFFTPGASSESATTSINNRSYSGTVQRSDEITVDSSVSGKRTIRLSMNKRDFDRSTDDSSTSQLSFKWKLTNMTSVAGKQLPRRSASIAFRKSEDGERKAKARKTETFQKELVMTSDQASMQNQRLPKGFFYVPVGSLSKEKPFTQDLEYREPREPGG